MEWYYAQDRQQKGPVSHEQFVELVGNGIVGADTLVWIDGDYGEAEQTVMLKLKKAHVATVDIDALIGKTNLKLDDNIN